MDHTKQELYTIRTQISGFYILVLTGDVTQMLDHILYPAAGKLSEKKHVSFTNLRFHSLNPKSAEELIC